MAIFNFKAKDKRGRNRRGSVVAISDISAVKILNRKGFDVSYIKDVSDSLSYKIIFLLNRINKKDLVVFSRQFSIMMNANVAITDSLVAIAEQTENIRFKNIISNIAHNVDEGMLLSEAFKKYPSIFSEFYCSVVKAGETSGKLDEVLNYLAEEIEKNYDLSKKIIGAFIYPAFIMTGLIAVGIVFLFFVLPELTKILEETGAVLPLSTRMVIAVTEFFRSSYIYIIIFIIGAIVFFKLFFRTPSGKKFRDIIILKMPVLGPIFQLTYLIRFCRSLGVLLRGGVVINRSLEIVGDVVSNTVYKEVITETIENINEGRAIVSAFEDSPYVPNMIPEMMSVGEKTGTLDEVLDKVAGFYEKDVNHKLANLNALIEPIIMVIMGIGVGIMVAAIIMPMYNMAGQF